MNINIKYLLLLFLVFALESFVSKILEKEQSNNLNKIIDNGFKIIPKIDFLFLDDIVLVIIPLIFLIFIYFCTKNNINFLDFVVIFLIIRFLRLLCLLCTIYPPPSKDCYEISDKKNKILPYYSYIFGGCNETIFSGHTACLVLIMLFIYPVLNAIGKIFIILYAIFGSIILISLRAHYTIDVLLGWIITYLVYTVYTCCKIKNIL